MNRYTLHESKSGTWYVRDEWRNRVLVEHKDKLYCLGFLDGMEVVK